MRLTEAREHDQKFLYHLKLVSNSWIVFDKAYTTYGQFAKWKDQKVWFVTRERVNADFHVTKVLIDKTKKRNAKEILKEQLVTVGVKQNGTVVRRLRLRRITYLSEKG